MNFGELDDILNFQEKYRIEHLSSDKNLTTNDLVKHLLSKVNESSFLTNNDDMGNERDEIASNIVSCVKTNSSGREKKSNIARECKWSEDEERALANVQETSDVMKRWKELCETNSNYRLRSKAAILKKYHRLRLKSDNNDLDASSETSSID
jgi:hypothetical protein